MQLPILAQPIFRENLIASFIVVADRGINPSQCLCTYYQGGCVPLFTGNRCYGDTVAQCGAPIHVGGGHYDCPCQCVGGQAPPR